MKNLNGKIAMMKIYVKLLGFLVVLFVLYTGYGQEKLVKLTGTVQSLNNDVSNVLVVNLNTETSTITDTLGRFTIEVKLRDSIRFSAVQYIPKEIIITDTILNGNMILVDLKEKVINLEEVIVRRYNLTGKIDLDIKRLGLKPLVTSSSLGLPNADVEFMTQSERLLFEADRGEFARKMTAEEKRKLTILGHLTIGAFINAHKIMNRASGRTKSYESMVSRDENAVIEKEIITLFSKKTMSEDFGIPEIKIDGFLTYCISQKDFSDLSNASNNSIIWEYLKAKSVEFKETDYPIE